MKFRYLFLIFCFTCLTIISSCNYKNHQQNQTALSHTDSLWLDFLSAIQRKDINYLIKNSLDTIQCGECNLISGKDDEYYEASFVFKNHFDKLLHLKDFKNKEFSTSEVDGELRVNYSVKAKYAEEGGYNLFFLFVKTDKGYLFKGMVVT